MLCFIFCLLGVIRGAVLFLFFSFFFSLVLGWVLGGGGRFLSFQSVAFFSFVCFGLRAAELATGGFFKLKHGRELSGLHGSDAMQIIISIY